MSYSSEDYLMDCTYYEAYNNYIVLGVIDAVYVFVEKFINEVYSETHY